MTDLFDTRPRRNLDGGRCISIRGAREHNLKNVDVDIPRDKLTVMTGLSGSGKSSLAFDTIYAEGQRRYVESLSAYARQFLELMQKPDVDHIEGLSPAISIEQKTTSKNPRSTVGTVTEIYDYLRLLLARVGVPYSPATGLPIESQTVSQMADRILALPAGTRLYLIAPSCAAARANTARNSPICRRRAFSASRWTANLRHRRRARARQEDQARHRGGGRPHRGEARHRPPPRRQSFEQALKLADGIAVVEFADGQHPLPRLRGRVGWGKSPRGGQGATAPTLPSPRKRGRKKARERQRVRVKAKPVKPSSLRRRPMPRSLIPLSPLAGRDRG